MGPAEVSQFLTHLAVKREVAASTQNQALAALLFLYRNVLKEDLPWLDNVVRAKPPAKIPLVLMRTEVRRLLLQLAQQNWLPASLLYGAGLRLRECLSLRVKDLDFGYQQIAVRDAKGNKDRLTMLPTSAAEALKTHLANVKTLHQDRAILIRGRWANAHNRRILRSVAPVTINLSSPQNAEKQESRFVVAAFLTEIVLRHDIQTLKTLNIELFAVILLIELDVDVGLLGLTVILSLAILLAAILLALLARRRTRQAVAANRELQDKIAERKHAEGPLRESQERTQAIIQSALDGIVTMDAEGRIIDFNAAAEGIFGHRSNEVVGRELADVIIPPDLREQHRQGLKHYLETGEGPIVGRRIEISGLRADGSLVLLELSISRMPGGEFPLFTGFLRDITERRQMEEARTQLSAIVESSDDAIISKTLEGVITSWNRGAELLFGYTANEAVGQPMALVIPADRANEELDILERIARGENVEHFETVRIGKGGRQIDVSVSISPIRDRHGKILGASKIARDITSRKQEQKERERFFALTGDLLVIGGFNGRFTWVSPACERALGWNSEELTSQPWLHFVHAEDQEKTVAEAEKLFRGEETISFENRYRHKDGSYRWISWKARAYMQEQSLYWAGTDISEQKLLEDQLRQAQKLESIGLLAGGVAHDFNNLLTVITGYSDLAVQRLRQDDPLRRNLEEIRKAADRAASLTRQLLAFSRKQVLEPKILDLRGTVSNMDKMLQRLIGEDIKLVTILEPQVGKVKVDPGQIEQVLMNLAVNARDAMPGGGMLTIETKEVFLDEAYTGSHVSAKPGPHVMLAVSDTGHGMDAETMAHIFEPFFTTKETGKGTGLGLAMVYGIVKQSGGNIWVYSEPQQGTTFKIYLPIVPDEAEAQRETVILSERESATETLLLVEDEDAVRTLLLNVLQSEGYTVLPASSGREALEACHEHDGPIHLLMTDVVMPGMSGRELVDRLAGKCKDVKVLYMSGYTDNAIVHHGVLEPGVAFIQKPFTLESVVRKIRQVLDSTN